jgi:hypothetical protein
VRRIAMAKTRWAVQTPAGTWEWECANPWTAIYRTYKHGVDDDDKLVFVNDDRRHRRIEYTGPDHMLISVTRVAELDVEVKEEAR